MNNTDNQSFGQDYQAPERAPNLALDLAIIQSATNAYRSRVIDAEQAVTNVHLENKKLREQLNEKQPVIDDEESHHLAYQLRIAQQQILTLQQKIEEQQMLLADWMVSQKAFKELAVQFGLEQGLTSNEVIEMGLDKKIDVLEDKNDPSHNTNVGDATLIGNRKEQLVEKYHKDKAQRKAKKIREESLSLNNNQNQYKGNI